MEQRSGRMRLNWRDVGGFVMRLEAGIKDAFVCWMEEVQSAGSLDLERRGRPTEIMDRMHQMIEERFWEKRNRPSENSSDHSRSTAGKDRSSFDLPG